MEQEITLYRYFDAAGCLLYVGITDNERRRDTEHGKAPWRREVTEIKYQRFPTRMEAHRAELAAIATERPKHNKLSTGEARRGQIFGERVRQLRTAKGITQEELATACKVTKSAVSQWECGHTENIRLHPLLALLRKLETSLPELLGEANS